MKFIRLLLICVFGLRVFDIQAQDHLIRIKVKGTTDTVAYLGYHFADKRYVLDTAEFNNDVVTFQNDEAYKPGLYFYYTPDAYFEFIVNEPKIDLETEGPDYVQNMIIRESEENKIFLKMQKYVSSKRKIYNELTEQIEASKEDSSKVEELKEQIKVLDSDVKEYQNLLADENEGTLAARMIRAMQKPAIPDSLIGEDPALRDKRYKYYKSHFFDGVDITDNGLLRTPVLNQKLMEYFDDVIIQTPDSVIKEVDQYLSKIKDDKEMYRYALVTLTSKYETSPIMGMDEVFVHIVEKYYLSGTADWVDNEMLKKLSERIATIKPNFIGNPAPPLTLNDTLFSTVALYDIQADFIILYFYDPDCGHCKKKTPVLYEAYSTLRNENVEVLAIDITTNTDRWKEYIKENEFDWINLSDSFNKSNFRYYYDIRSTPTIYILDKDKTIIAKKLDASQVESFIHQMQQQLESGGE